MDPAESWGKKEMTAFLSTFREYNLIRFASTTGYIPPSSQFINL
jgi:hypothetical protein